MGKELWYYGRRWRVDGEIAHRREGHPRWLAVVGDGYKGKEGEAASRFAVEVQGSYNVRELS